MKRVMKKSGAKTPKANSRANKMAKKRYMGGGKSYMKGGKMASKPAKSKLRR